MGWLRPAGAGGVRFVWSSLVGQGAFVFHTCVQSTSSACSVQIVPVGCRDCEGPNIGPAVGASGWGDGGNYHDDGLSCAWFVESLGRSGVGVLQWSKMLVFDESSSIMELA